MLTPKLEELILKGRAFFKTFVAGGTKHTLSFGDDRFIIITDITYFPMNIPDKNTEPNHNTQVAIYGERGYNHFIFRNYNNTNINNPGIHGFCSPTTIDLYLMHTKQVGFSFVNAPYFTNLNTGVASGDNPAYNAPLEYGKDGDPGAIPVILTWDAFNGPVVQNNLTTRPAPTITESQQLFFPFSNDGSFRDSFGDKEYEYPLLHVNYVEILGLPNNLSI
jgi:hypothetical protein